VYLSFRCDLLSRCDYENILSIAANICIATTTCSNYRGNINPNKKKVV